MMPNLHSCKLHTRFMLKKKSKYCTLKKYIKNHLPIQTVLFCNMF